MANIVKILQDYVQQQKKLIDDFKKDADQANDEIDSLKKKTRSLEMVLMTLILLLSNNISSLHYVRTNYF